MWPATLFAGAAGAILTLGVLGAVAPSGESSDNAGTNVAVPTSAPIASAPFVSSGGSPVPGRSVVRWSRSASTTSRARWRGSGVGVRRTRGTVTTASEILTSNRLVGSSDHVVSATTSDGVVHQALIVGRDATSDLVLLRLASGIPAARVGAGFCRSPAARGGWSACRGPGGAVAVGEHRHPRVDKQPRLARNRPDDERAPRDGSGVGPGGVGRRARGRRRKRHRNRALSRR